MTKAMPDFTNQEALSHLQDCLASPQKPLALVGAGSSKRVGYPTWQEFLEIMHKEAISEKPEQKTSLDIVASGSDALWMADEYQQSLSPGRFEQLIRDTFGPYNAKCDDFHRALVMLPFHHILTTNYDTVLESAHISVHKEAPQLVDLNNRSDVSEFIEDLSNSFCARRYIPLHGRYNSPSQVVLGEKSYQKRYVTDPLYQSLMSNLVQSHRIVFIGLSLQDLDLLGLFRNAQARKVTAPRHFALLPAKAGESTASDRMRLKQKYGITPVYYPYSEDHQGLVDLVSELGKGNVSARPQVVLHPQNEGLAVRLNLSAQAKQILDEQGFGWEPALFFQVLVDKIDSLGELRRDFDYKVYIGERTKLEPLAFSERARDYFETLGNLFNQLLTLYNVALPDALGKPGEPSDVESLAYVAKRIADAYRTAIESGMAWHKIYVASEFETLAKLLSEFCRGLVVEISGSAKKMLQKFSDLKLQGPPADGSKIVIVEHLSPKAPRDFQKKLNIEFRKIGKILASATQAN